MRARPPEIPRALASAKHAAILVPPQDVYGPRMNGWPTVGVAGARGVVGGVFCSILADAGLPAECLRAFGHEEGNSVEYARSIGPGARAR